jgi:hypothetical protein
MPPTPPVLPYRTDEEDLQRLLAGLARGRSLDQIRSQGFSPKSFDGVLTTAQALALIADKEGSLTEAGRSYTLIKPEYRSGFISAALRSFPPFALALSSALQDGPKPTPLDWLVTWWAAHGYGSSESNRSEAAPVFAKLVEAAGLGRYVQGRKGHPSRIEWLIDALPPPSPEPAAAGSSAPRQPSTLPTARAPARATGSDPSAEGRGATAPTVAGSAAAAPVAAVTASPDGEVGATTVSWLLAPGKEVLLRFPVTLTAAERERVLRLAELLLQS